MMNNEKDESEIRESILSNRRSVIEQNRKSTNINEKLFVEIYNIIEEKDEDQYATNKIVMDG